MTLRLAKAGGNIDTATSHARLSCPSADAHRRGPSFTCPGRIPPVKLSSSILSFRLLLVLFAFVGHFPHPVFFCLILLVHILDIHSRSPPLPPFLLAHFVTSSSLLLFAFRSTLLLRIRFFLLPLRSRRTSCRPPATSPTPRPLLVRAASGVSPLRPPYMDTNGGSFMQSDQLCLGPGARGALG